METKNAEVYGVALFLCPTCKTPISWYRKENGAMKVCKHSFAGEICPASRKVVSNEVLAKGGR
jgi:hypothetical protein